MDPTSYISTICYALDHYTGDKLDKAIRDACAAMADRFNDEPHQAAYFDDVQSMADKIVAGAVDALRSGETHDASEWISDRLHADCDGSWWVIYHHAAAATLRYSDNSDAYFDEIGDLDGIDSLGQLHTICAYYALRADVMERIDMDEIEAAARVPSAMWVLHRYVPGCLPDHSTVVAWIGGTEGEGEEDAKATALEALEEQWAEEDSCTGTTDDGARVWYDAGSQRVSVERVDDAEIVAQWWEEEGE